MTTLALRFGRLATVVLCATALACSALAVVSTARASLAAPAEDSRIAADVVAALDGGRTGDFWVRLADNADTKPAASAADRTERGRQVVDALRAAADRSQEPVRRLLDGDGVAYTGFWVSNAIRVRDGSLELARRIAALPGVVEITAPRVYPRTEPVQLAPADVVPAAVEWGLDNIHAPQAWAEGAQGTGIVVANIDTGVQFDHPALARQYRGNNGDGTFTHDYNWFDPSRVCPSAAPCDFNGHGTHTMGTMAGDDGAGNQIGVAPQARWIAAMGCESAGCSDFALVASSQWVLAPTDSNGQNPDVTKRPHVVNNSWGSSPPSNDPYLEDIQQAWADSGIFAAWANGNDGELGCASSGSPGSRTLNYSVGAYDANDGIAWFSGRGPGQDGEIKPSIAAPGVNVRSSTPDNGYGLGSGTSMATPHVAGAVALLWSKWPVLARDIGSTRLLLDLSARDTEDLTCGGTVNDNNVFGEGRLDANALVQSGAAGVGTLSGRVTDSATGAPVADAPVSVDGVIDRVTRTGQDGAYSLTTLAGDYQLSVTGLFGYRPYTATVTVPRGAGTHDVALEQSARVAITGVVTDGGGHGWPLYARVSAADGHGHDFATYTDPVTGHYALPVVGDTAYTVTVTAVVAGYQPVARPVEVGAVEVVLDVALPLAPSCVAPGYVAQNTGRTETFDRRSTPSGWRVVNTDPRYPGYNASPGWVFSNPAQRANNTGGGGNFAVVDSDHYGQHHVQDTVLSGPAVNLTGQTTPLLEFATDINPAVNSTATVELSADGGGSWAEIWRSAGFTGPRGPGVHSVPVPQAAGAPAVQVRFRYTGQWSGWWQLDNVFLGNRRCLPVPGGLVVGQVSADDSSGLTGATVTDAIDPSVRAVTVATADDPALGDGVYWLFSPNTGQRQFTAAIDGHTPRTSPVTVTADQATRLDFVLPRAG